MIKLDPCGGTNANASSHDFAAGSADSNFFGIDLDDRGLKKKREGKKGNGRELVRERERERDGMAHAVIIKSPPSGSNE